MKRVLVAFVYLLLFAYNHGYTFQSFLQFSKNSICKNDVCRSKPEVVPHVMQGLVVALRECQYQLNDRRWNCTEKGGSLEKIMRHAYPQSAFLSAINAAGVIYVVTRACSLGDLKLCGCDVFKYRGGGLTTGHPQETANRKVEGEFVKRGVCDRNIEFGEEISRLVFSDKRTTKDARSELMQWNYEAGRKALRKFVRKNCKCFGYSGTCTHNACWLVLPPSFSQVGAHLKERFDAASKVSFGNKGKTFHVFDKSLKPPSEEDLVYTTDPPSFCDADASVGSFGTKGRYCNKTSIHTDGCDVMCCSRGFTTTVEHSQKYCKCSFEWCCVVKCKTCPSSKAVNRCL